MTRTHFFLCALAGTLAACSPGGDYPRSGYDDDDGAPYDDDDDGYDDDDATWNEEDDGSDEPPLDDDDDASDDDDTTDEEDESCEDSAEEPLTWYLSADDSNSQAAPTLARQVIGQGGLLHGGMRPYEFLNYYDFYFPAAPAGEEMEYVMHFDNC